MTLRKKLMLSNILTVVLPVAVTLILWTLYVHVSSDTGLKQIRRASDGGDTMTEAMNILYTFEAELSDMQWDIVAFPGENGTEIALSPEKERIEEMNSLGYHIRVEDSRNVLFSNMDESDEKILSGINTGTEGILSWSKGGLVVRDSFRISGQTYYLTAVYDKNRVDMGVQKSLVPMYMISPSMLLVLLLAAIVCFVVTAVLMSGWMNRSVLVPLEELKAGADQIARGDLEHGISYPKEDEFGDVCRAFDHMRLQLKEAKKEQKHYEEQRRSLLRGISHDLRSPLTSIKGYAQGIRDQIADTKEKRIRYCNAILTRAEDMERLTGSLSLLVRLEQDSSLLHPQRVCLDEYLHQLLQEKESWLTEQRIEPHYQNRARDAEVCLDIHEMQRVFMNLFENTVKYRRSDHSEVRLEVSKTEQMVQIAFADDGPGIEKEHLQDLFEPFYRGDEARTDPGSGSGIGLAVVKQIIEGQGGTVSAESENGLCIIMKLPLV